MEESLSISIPPIPNKTKPKAYLFSEIVMKMKFVYSCLRNFTKKQMDVALPA